MVEPKSLTQIISEKDFLVLAKVPCEQFFNIFFLFKRRIQKKKDIPIYGKGENIRDWLFVEDHAKAIDVIFHHGVIGETYNVGGNNERENIEVVKEI